MPTLTSLVRNLPNLYQPIYGHPELSESASRMCDDRLHHVAAVCRELQTLLSRPVRVLDLGCAQGYFSHSLAAHGASVHGIDWLEQNIAVCARIAEERGDRGIRFERADVADILPRLEADHYDLVLGLSILHHIIHKRGSAWVGEVLRGLGSKVFCCLFELALRDEPLSWAASQPASPRDLLSSFAFVHEIGRHETHLSAVPRPLYFASNYCWFLEGRTGTFGHWGHLPCAQAPGTREDARRFYLGDRHIVKLLHLDDEQRKCHNLQEWSREVAFLADPPVGFLVPKLEAHGRNAAEAWIVRERLPSETLANVIAAGQHEPRQFLHDV